MIKCSSVIFLTSSALSLMAIGNLPSQAQSVEFTCAVDPSNIPTTYAQTPDGTVEVFKWRSTYFSPPYTPMQRCLEVSDRLNHFQPDVLVAGKVNNYNVICAGQRCDRQGSNILLTLRPDQNPEQVLYEIDQTRDAAGGPSMQLNGGTSSGSRQGSNLQRTADGSLSLNLRQYIQTAPKIPMRFGNSPQPPAPTPSLTPAVPTAPQSSPGSSRGRAW